MALSTITAALYARDDCSLARGDAPVQRDREGYENQEYSDAPNEGLPAVRAYGLAEQEAPHRVDDLRYRLVVGEGLQYPRHVVRHHERAGGEDQGEEPDEARRLHGLGAPQEERYGSPDPGERETEQQQEPDGPGQAREPCLRTETDENPDGEHHQDNEEVADQVGDGTAREYGGACHGQRAEPIDEALLEVLGKADARAYRSEGHGLYEDAGHKVVDVALAAHVDCAPEHVTEQQHEHDRLYDREDQKLGNAWDLYEVALGEHPTVGESPVELAVPARLQTAFVCHRAHAISFSSTRCSASGSAAWPVRVRNTSSRVGRCRPSSSTCTPAVSNSLTTAARRPGPPATVVPTYRRSASTRTPPSPCA